MKQRILIILGIVIVLVVLLFAVARTPVVQIPPSKPIVVTSFYPIYYLTSAIVGGHMDVRNMTPNGVEPHDYEPSATDLRAIEKSSAVILNGGGLEAWSSNIKYLIDSSKTSVVTLSDKMAVSQISDPHYWLSPVRAQQMADEILKTIISVDPANASSYEANAMKLKSKLIALDDDFKTGLSACAKKDFVTSHSAFGYLASQYGLTQVSIAGLSPESEPSPKQLMETSAFVRTHDIDIIFFESLVSPKFSETIATETGARTLVLDPIEGISHKDQLEGKDYISLMRENLTNLRTALHCTP